MATKLFPVLSILIYFSIFIFRSSFITFGWPIIFSSRCSQIVFTGNDRTFGYPNILFVFFFGLFFFIIPFNHLCFRKTFFALLVFGVCLINVSKKILNKLYTKKCPNILLECVHLLVYNVAPYFRYQILKPARKGSVQELMSL